MLRFGEKYLANKNSRVVLNYYNKQLNRKYSNEGNLPKHADVVVVGGGIIGCNTFYHLAKKGVKVVLLERNKITNGTTWHTGGLVGSLSPNDTDILILQRTRQHLQELEKEFSSGWVNNGGIYIARTPERLEEYKRMHTIGHYFHIDSQILSPSEAQKLCPILDPQTFYAAMHCPSDGFVDPTMYCNALVKGALKYGGEIFESTPVTRISTEHTLQGLKKVTGVETSKGDIKTGLVVNTAGAWSRNISRMVGLDIPITVMKHSYVITGDVAGAKGGPSVRDHDGSVYFRPQGNSVLMGGFENNPEVLREVPDDFNYSLYEKNLGTFDSLWNKACELCPSFEKTGIKSTIQGPEDFTPDHRPIMGEDPKVIGFFHGAGFNSLGVQLSGGAGEQLAYWVTMGRPELPMHNYDIRRFTPSQRNDRAWIIERSHESYAKTYRIVYPHDQPLAGRNFRTDPFHELLVASGAVMEQALGWERPAYFIQDDRVAPVKGYDWLGYYDHVPNEDKRYENELEKELTFGFSKNHDLVKDEALACRNNVALFDLSCYTKMYLTGPDAEHAADWLFTADLRRDPGKVAYSLSLNSRGGVEADVIVTTLEEGVGTLVGPILKGRGYYIVAGGATGYRTISHLRKQMYKRGFKSLITEVTERLGILSIQGPKSGELLQSITEFPITDDRFPPQTSNILKINNHICRAVRRSYVGELGYELHIPSASCVAVYNKIIEAGRGFDLKHAGFRALDALSCEKGYHRLNFDLRISDNPVEAGAKKFCRKDGQYQGKTAVEKAKQEGVKKQRVFFTLNDQVALYGQETIWRDDSIVGYLRRGNYGFSLDCPVGLGYVEHPKGKVVDAEYLKSGDYQIEVRNKKYPATLYLNSPFDPQHKRRIGQYEHQFVEQSHFED